MNVNEIKNSAKNVVFAGLGVVSIAQKEATKIYDNLVKEGQKFEKETVKSVKKVTDEAEDKVKGIKSMASKQFNKIENMFEGKIESVLGKLDIPSTDDIKNLGERVEKLIKEIEKSAKKAA